MYIENLSHRECWIRLYVTFDSSTHTTSSLLLHLLPSEREFIEQRLKDEAMYPFTLHPLFVPTIVMELLFQEALKCLSREFDPSVSLYIEAEFHSNERYRHLKKEDLDVEKASETSLGHEQQILILLEKLESNVKMGNQLLTWFDEFPTDKFSAEQRTRFESAGTMLRNRLESLIDGFGFQLVRLKRVQGHAQLNRLGVCKNPRI
jgi:hypothetical protein